MPNFLFFKILCILSFIGSGIMVFYFGIIGITYDHSSSLLEGLPDEQSRDLINLLLSGGRLFFVLTSILFGISFVGVMFLWKMKKIGFHLYSVSQITILIVILIFIKEFPGPLFNIFHTVLFIWGYSGYLKFMK